MSTTDAAFARSCEQEARFRDEKYTEHGDQRNLRSAEALRAVATWALTAEDAPRRLAELLHANVESGTGFLLLNGEARRIFSMYCFHRPEELDRWLRRVAHAHYSEEYDDELDELLDS